MRADALYQYSPSLLSLFPPGNYAAIFASGVRSLAKLERFAAVWIAISEQIVINVLVDGYVLASCVTDEEIHFPRSAHKREGEPLLEIRMCLW